MTTGWMFRSSWGRACARISPAGERQCQFSRLQKLSPLGGANERIPNIMTVVVPSPTSSSCVLLNSIMLFAAGCATSISRKIAWPSLVSTMPPIGSSSIFSIALGPRHDRMISATVLAAVMFDNCAFRPNWRSPPGVWVSEGMLGAYYDKFCAEHLLMTTTGACILEDYEGIIGVYGEFREKKGVWAV